MVLNFSNNFKQTEILATKWCQLIVATIKIQHKWYITIESEIWGGPDNWIVIILSSSSSVYFSLVTYFFLAC